MSLRSQNNIYLVGPSNFNITGSKLPSNKQVLAVFFYNVRTVKLSTRESANLVVRETLIFWEKARIPTKQTQHCVSKILKLYEEWRYLQKNNTKSANIFRERENEFKNNLDNLFDVAHAEAMSMMKIDEDKQFLTAQRKPGREGCMGSIDNVYMEAEKKREKRRQEDIVRQQHHLATKIPRQSKEHLFEDTSDSSSRASNDEYETCEQQPVVLKRARTHFITPKLVAVLDRCHVSARNAVFILQATAEALGHKLDDLVINKTSIQDQRDKLRSERAQIIKNKFKEMVQPYLVVHWDGKLLPALNIHEKAVERLPIIVTGTQTEQILEIPKLKNSSGEAQATAVFNALEKWELKDKVSALCCDTTASNTGRLNGACVLLEKKLGKDLLYLPCRHHIYELLLKAVFEKKLPQLTRSPDVPLFKKFKSCWDKINPNAIKSGMNNEVCRLRLEPVATEIMQFVQDELAKKQIREDYREFLELVMYFLSTEEQNPVKIRPPGAMHHARWMSRAIYSLKIFLLREQFSIDAEENALADVCVFIIKFYVQAWFKCTNASQAAVNDLSFLNDLTSYRENDPVTSEAALQKFRHHLWYLTEETSALAFFDERLDASTKKKMVEALKKEAKVATDKKLKMDYNDIEGLKGKSIDHFITSRSKNLFTRLKINTEFLNEDPEKWGQVESFSKGKETIKLLKVINDTAERAVKLVEDYHGLIKKDESQIDFMLHCVQEHRKLYPNCTKTTLSQEFDY